VRDCRIALAASPPNHGRPRAENALKGTPGHRAGVSRGGYAELSSAVPRGTNGFKIELCRGTLMQHCRPTAALA